MIEPRSIPELIDAFGGPTEFAKVIGKNPSTASEMKRAGSIRVNYWTNIVDAAAEKAIPGVSLDSIARMHMAATTSDPAASEASV